MEKQRAQHLASIKRQKREDKLDEARWKKIQLKTQLKQAREKEKVLAKEIAKKKALEEAELAELALSEEEKLEREIERAKEHLRILFEEERKNISKKVIIAWGTTVEVPSRKYLRTFFDTDLKEGEEISEEIKNSIMPADGVRYYLDSLIENYRKNKKKIW